MSSPPVSSSSSSLASSSLSTQQQQQQQHSSPPRRYHHRPRVVPTSTPQMQVMGRDDRDLFLLSSPPPPTMNRNRSNSHGTHLSSNDSTNNNNNPSSRTPSWWDGVTVTATTMRWKNPLKKEHHDNINDNDIDDATRNQETGHYTALDETPTLQLAAAAADTPSFSHSSLLTTSTSSLPPKVANIATAAPASKYQLLHDDDTNDALPKSKALPIPSIMPRSKSLSRLQIPTSSPTPPTVEDQVRADCSFFYHDMNDEGNHPPRHDDYNTNRPSSMRNYTSTSLLPPRHRAEYRARYQKLNQDIWYKDDDDLELFQESSTGASSQPHFPRVTEFSNSSLYYRQDGRVWMKLPNDKVRLVMQDDMEPGILSVVSGGHTHDGTTTTPPTELTYVLTVPLDLYQRVVRDIANAKTAPCGLYHCGSEEHVHIHVAVAILTVIMLLFIINILIFPVD